MGSEKRWAEWGRKIGVLSADTKGTGSRISDSDIRSLNATKPKTSTKWADAWSIVIFFYSFKTYRVQKVNERVFLGIPQLTKPRFVGSKRKYDIKIRLIFTSYWIPKSDVIKQNWLMKRGVNGQKAPILSVPLENVSIISITSVNTTLLPDKIKLFNKV